MTEVSFKEVQAASEEPDVTLVQAKESEMAGNYGAVVSSAALLLSVYPTPVAMLAGVFAGGCSLVAIAVGGDDVVDGVF
jgi:predicted phage tail protein